MALADISLQRISLGAMMIAMGMLVDNAIVVVEGMLVGVQMGMKPVEAASALFQEPNSLCWAQPLSASWHLRPLVSPMMPVDTSWSPCFKSLRSH